jgi:2-polyprenyl-3-methyl-5-hydroxy-6-metoxy-1,4-benzoquinol methylase
MIVSDIEQLSLEETFPGEQLDVILFGDVLEHLRDPAAVLRKLQHLAPSGYLVSLPNVAHGSIRLAVQQRLMLKKNLGSHPFRFFAMKTIAALLPTPVIRSQSCIEPGWVFLTPK